MDAIYIPRLAKAPEQTEAIRVQEFLPGLDTLTPVQGELRVTHHGNYLRVTAQAEAITTLTCDRCLQQYNYRLICDTSELIWLQEQGKPAEVEPQELNLEVEELIETLSPQGYFYPDDWLYQQMCLSLPQRQLCDPTCPGIAPVPQSLPAPLDRRWAALEVLKQSLNS